jgi:hypothetical protein
MERLLVSTGALLLFSVSSQAFDFKGIEVGGFSTAETVYKTLRDPTARGGLGAGVSCRNVADDAHVCDGSTTVAGVFAKANIAISNEGLVTHIELRFESQYFSTVAQGAIDKYGKPAATRKSVVQNRMGATDENIELAWGSPKGSYIRLIRYSGNLDEATLYFGTAEDTAFLESQIAPKKKTSNHE